MSQHLYLKENVELHWLKSAVFFFFVIVQRVTTNILGEDNVVWINNNLHLIVYKTLL